MEALFEVASTHIFGPQGGYMAVGGIIGWLLCSNTMLKDARKRIGDLETEMKSMRADFTAQIGDLRSRYEDELRMPRVPAHMVKPGALDKN